MNTINAPAFARIDSSKVPVGGGLPAGLVIVTLFIGAFHDVEILRELALPGILAGLLFGAFLHLWRRSHLPRPPVTLHLTDDMALTKNCHTSH